MAPGVIDDPLMLQTTTFTVFALAKVETCSLPVPYPVTPIGVDAQLHFTTLLLASPLRVVVCTRQVLEDSDVVDKAIVADGVAIGTLNVLTEFVKRSR